MAQNFLACDREQELLLPPSLREWLPEGHLAWFVIDAVAEMDLTAFYAAYREDGHGRAAHDPAMMVALLLYAYAVGRRSSRVIERACVDDVAFRVIAANQRPDHCTIARFRQRHEAALAGLFGEVLALCADAGLVGVAVLAVDGTKVHANASQHQNLDYDEVAKEILAEADAVDRAEDERFGDRRGDELPPELSTAQGRRGWLRDAKRRLDERRAAEGQGQHQRSRLAQRQDAARLHAGLQRAGRLQREPDRRGRGNQRRLAGLRPPRADGLSGRTRARRRRHRRSAGGGRRRRRLLAPRPNGRGRKPRHANPHPTRRGQTQRRPTGLGRRPLRVHAPRARDRPRQTALPKTPGHNRARVREPQVQPPDRPLLTPRQIRLQVGMAANHRNTQPAQAPPQPKRARNDLKEARRGPRRRSAPSPRQRPPALRHAPQRPQAL